MKRSVNKMNRVIALILAGGLLFSGNSLVAQTNVVNNDTTKIITLDKVVISATRNEQNLAEVGRSITVISNKEIENSMYNNVGDLLAEQEGIYLVGVGQNFGANQRAFLRGTNSYHSIIMIDGVRISDPSSVDNGIDLAELSLNNVERIEIVRGSHSTIYGSSAIGGVINIITKKNNLNSINASIDMNYGYFGKGTSSFITDFFVNYNHKKGFYTMVSANHTNVLGIDATLDTVTNPAVYKNRDKDDYSKTDYVTKFGFRNDRFDVFASYKRIDQSSDLDRDAFIDDDNRVIDFSRNLANYGMSYKLSNKLKLNLSGGYSDMQRTDVNDSSVVDTAGNYDHQYAKSIFDGSSLTYDLVANYNVKKVALTMGGGVSEERMNNFNYIYSNSAWGLYENTTDLDSLNLKAVVKNVFIHMDLKGGLVNEKLNSFSLALGGRLSNHNEFGNYITYEVNPSYKISSNSLLYASYSTGFNAPSLYRLYEPYKGFGAYTARGNKNLNPETSATFELGMKQMINKNTNITLSYFNTVVDNIIEYVYLWDKNIGIDTLGNDWMRNDFRGDTYINLSKQKIDGIEVGINSALSNKLTIDANFSFMNGILTFSSKEIDTVQTGENHIQLFESGLFISDKQVDVIGLVRRPNNIVNLALTYNPVKQLSLMFATRFVGSRNDAFFNSSLKPYGAMDKMLLGGYNVSDVTVRYALKENLSLNLKIENILNTDYMEINGFATRGRGVYVKVKYIFTKTRQN